MRWYHYAYHKKRGAGKEQIVLGSMLKKFNMSMSLSSYCAVYYSAIYNNFRDTNSHIRVKMKTKMHLSGFQPRTFYKLTASSAKRILGSIALYIIVIIFYASSCCSTFDDRVSLWTKCLQLSIKNTINKQINVNGLHFPFPTNIPRHWQLVIQEVQESSCRCAPGILLC